MLPESINKLNLSAELKNKIDLKMTKTKKFMTSGSTLRCYGDSCPLRESCDLWQAKKAPIGQDCPFEEEYARSWLEEKFNNEQLNLDPENYLDRLYASELTQIDVLEWRAMSMLNQASGASLTILDVKDVDENRNPLAYELKEHPLVNTLDRLHHRRVKLLTDLIATRREAGKLLNNSGKNMLASNMASKLSGVRQRLLAYRSNSLELIEAEDIQLDKLEPKL